jgi:hypothetical protein
MTTDDERIEAAKAQAQQLHESAERFREANPTTPMPGDEPTMQMSAADLLKEE